jgi:hypothetical protein
MQERHDCEPKARQSRVVLLNKYLEKFTILDCRAALAMTGVGWHYRESGLMRRVWIVVLHSQ